MSSIPVFEFEPLHKMPISTEVRDVMIEGIPAFENYKLFEQLEEEIPDALSFMRECITELGLDDKQAHNLAHGYVLTATTVLIEDELHNGPNVGIFNMEIARGLFYCACNGITIEDQPIEEDEDDDEREPELPIVSYTVRRVKEIVEDENKLLQVWREYTKTDGKKSKDPKHFNVYFALGGVVAHDVLLEHINVTRLIEFYTSNLGEAAPD